MTNRHKARHTVPNLAVLPTSRCLLLGQHQSHQRLPTLQARARIQASTFRPPLISLPTKQQTLATQRHLHPITTAPLYPLTSLVMDRLIQPAPKPSLRRRHRAHLAPRKVPRHQPINYQSKPVSSCWVTPTHSITFATGEEERPGRSVFSTHIHPGVIYSLHSLLGSPNSNLI